MNDSPLEAAGRAIVHGIAALRAASNSSATADARIAALVMCEQITRQVDQLSVELAAGLDREGVFSERGYSRPALAVADLIGCDPAAAGRRVRAAEQVIERSSLDGEVLPPRLPATAEVFRSGEIGLRHVEVIADALASRSAHRLAPAVWAGVEQQLAGQAGVCRPRELEVFAVSLITALDQDGEAPDDREIPQLNELYLAATPAQGGGRIKGQLDAQTFDALATALSAWCTPVPEDTRGLPERWAGALGQVCRHVLDHRQTSSVGGEQPHLSVTIPLTELEGRARGAVLDFGGALTPTAARMLACDARVIPVVLGSQGQPLDVGRAVRTVPGYLRRAVAVRDRGCAFPGCDRRPSWCDVHHVPMPLS